MTCRRILICDDELPMTDYLAKVCLGLGHLVRVLTDSRMFAPAFREFDPTDIILDIVMPGIDGFELINCALDAGFRGRLVIVSGYNPHYGDIAKRLSEAKGIAAPEFLQKPFTLAELRRLLAEKELSPVLVIEGDPADVRPA